MSKLCTAFGSNQVCFNNGTTNQTLFIHFQYGIDAAGKPVVVSKDYRDANNVRVDVSAGTVTAGACAIIPPDIEFEIACDTSATGVVTEFFHRIITTFDSTGAPTVTVVNVALDKVTPYVVTGTVGACSQDCDPAVPDPSATAWG